MTFGHDNEAPDYRLISQRKVKGRKDHVCCDCLEVIPAGTPHAVHVYVEDGEFLSQRMHGFGYPSCPRDIAAEQEEAAKERAEIDRLQAMSQHGEWR